MTRRKPNILWIVTTQWRARACGYAGDGNARTPYLDALAAESINYAQAVTPHPFGPMARAALLTGVLSPENGVRDYFDALPADSRTIAHEMKARGYATAFFGKWGVGKRNPRVPLVGEEAARVLVPPGERGGFDVWDGFEGGFLLNDPWLHGRDSEQPVEIKGYQSEVVCTRAGRYLSEKASEDQPWFAIVSLEAPHPPYAAPANGVHLRAEEAIVLAGNVPQGGEVEERARRELAGYYAHIEATDRAIGTALLSRVTREGTVVVFTSVHGDMHGAHGLFRKGWPQEESVRVPLLVRGGGGGGDRGAESGESVDDGAVSLVELSAMTTGWADEVTVERREWSAISMPSVVALPHQCDRVWRGGRTRERKLVLDGRGEPWLFFDLERDPLEMKNLAGEAARRGEIEAWRARLDER
jgi:arylsulfatase A-like enzyme